MPAMKPQHGTPAARKAARGSHNQNQSSLDAMAKINRNLTPESWPSAPSTVLSLTRIELSHRRWSPSLIFLPGAGVQVVQRADHHARCHQCHCPRNQDTRQAVAPTPRSIALVSPKAQRLCQRFKWCTASWHMNAIRISEGRLQRKEVHSLANEVGEADLVLPLLDPLLLLLRY